MATPDGGAATGKHGDEFDADFAVDEHDPEWYADEYVLLVVPGGRAPERLRTEAPAAAAVVAAFVEADLLVAAICHGAQPLVSADVIEGHEIAAYWTLQVDLENAGAEFVDGPAVVDEPFVTARVPDDLPAFVAATLDLLDVGVEAERASPPA